MATGYRTHDHNGTPNPLSALSDEQLAEIGRELDQLHDEVRADLSLEDTRAASEELADILIYVVRLADVLGVDLAVAAEAKLALNAERYPVVQPMAPTNGTGGQT